MRALLATSLAAIAVLLGSFGSASAQCARWRTDLHLPGFDRNARAMVEHDDGSGPSLFVGGEFANAASVACASIARWDGTRFWPVGTGVTGAVEALVVFDDGAGPTLFAAGKTLSPAQILRWDGATWSSAMGSAVATEVSALLVYDDGSGPVLHAAGRWIGTGPLSNVARWNGTTWIAIGGGLDQRVSALAGHDDGGGTALYCATVDTQAGASVRRWNGTSWLSIGTFPRAVQALASFDDGAGPTLWAGGGFQLNFGPPTDGLRRWDGTAWTTAPSPSFAEVNSLSVMSFGGAPPKLYVGGATLISIVVGGSIFEVHSWDGILPVRLGLAMDGAPRALVPFDSGAGPELHACGDFDRIDGLAFAGIARFEGSAWTTLVPHVAPAKRVTCFSGPVDRIDAETYAGGDFLGVGDAPAGYVARWNADGWEDGGTGLDVRPRALCWFDDGSGPTLYAGGMDPSNHYPGGIEMNVLARRVGSTWQLVPGRPDGPVYALATFDDGSGPALFVGGGLGSGPSWSNFGVLKYDGTSWIPIGSAMDEPVRALHVHDDGTGPALYAGGYFTTAGGVDALRVARWNGTSWSKVGSGFTGTSGGPRVLALATFDDGTGPALYAGGQAGLGAAVRKWDGTRWSAVGSTGMPSSVSALVAWDDGGGRALYASAFHIPALGGPGIARWDGTSWTVTGSGVPMMGSNESGVVEALHVLDDGSGNGPALLAGGSFASIDGVPSGNLAIRQGCAATGVAYCFGTSASCPCANGGAAGRGCANSANPGGGRLTLSGQPFVSADSVVLDGSGMTNGAALYFQGTAQVGGGAGVPLFDGLRCVSGPTIRLGTRENVAGASSLPEPGGASISARGFVPHGGATRHYHVLYRDLAPSFCTPSRANTTNALAVHWLP